MSGPSDRLAAIALLASLAGFAIAAYLTAAHYGGAPLACVGAGAVDCEAVTSSSYSLVPGTSLPVTIPGLLFFALDAALALSAVIRRVPTWLPPAQVALNASGLIVVLYLVYAEIVVIGRICEWCTAVHLLVLLLFVLSLRRLQEEL